jgi:hypothetical protein
VRYWAQDMRVALCIGLSLTKHLTGADRGPDGTFAALQVSVNGSRTSAHSITVSLPYYIAHLMIWGKECGLAHQGAVVAEMSFGDCIAFMQSYCCDRWIQLVRSSV